MHSRRRLLNYVLRQWRVLLAIFILTVMLSSTAALQPWPMKLLVDYGLQGKPLDGWLASWFAFFAWDTNPASFVIAAGVASLGVFLVSSLLNIALSLAWNVAGQRMVYDLAGDLFAQLQRMSLLFHNRRNLGDSLSRLTDDTWCIYTLTDSLLTPIHHVLTLLVMASVGFALDPVLTGLALVAAPLLALSSSYFGKRLKQRSKLGREAKAQLTSFIHQTLGAIPIVQTFGSEDRNVKRFHQLADESVVLAERGSLLTSGFGLINGLITTSGMAVVLFVGGMRVLDGVIPLGTLLVFLAYVRQMQDASTGLFDVFAKLKNAEASIDRIMEVLESNEVVHDPPHPVSFPVLARGNSGAIDFHDVTFGYTPERPVLYQISLSVKPGEVIALVGPTGAGKSSLVSMIPRFFDPLAGSITFDGIDLRKIGLAQLRQRISIVLQEPYIMPQSIAANIAFGRRDATREEIIAAAVAAQADGFIQRLPDGYETIVGERGASLSGGERQRLAIARALLKDAPLLILDEPTSALDLETEAAFIEALQRLMQGRTTFVIAHRLSTIRHADRIAVLDQGRLVQLGTHAELVQCEGLYQQLYECHFSKQQAKVLV
jgi:ATP-binding cassette, subfamily B, bacterial